MSDSEAGKSPNSQYAVARLFHASATSGAISISLVKVMTAFLSWRCCISRMPRIISSRCPASDTMIHCSQIADSRLCTARGSVAVCNLANKVSSMGLLPPFCASVPRPSIMPSRPRKQARRLRIGILFQDTRRGAAGGPIQQFNRVSNRNGGARRDVADAAKVAGGDEIGPQAFDVGHFALAQGTRQCGLQDLIGAGPAAAEMALGHVLYDESRGAQQFLGLLIHLLAVLHGTGRMIGHGERPRGHVRETDLEHELAHVLGQSRHLLGLFLPYRIVGQQMAVVLERGAAARGVDRKSTRLNSSHVRISYAVFC